MERNLSRMEEDIAEVVVSEREEMTGRAWSV